MNRFLSSGLRFARRQAAPIAVGGLHVLLGLMYRVFAEVNVDWSGDSSRNTWDYLWQTIPMDLLKDRLWESLWYSHAQPPLFNVYGLVNAKWFAHAPLQAQHLSQILMGGLLAAMAVSVVRSQTGKTGWAVVAGLFVALNPVLFLYEAYILYTFLAAFWVMVSVWTLSRYHDTERTRWLAAFLAALNLLFLTRGLYHLILILPVTLLLLFHAPARWKRILLLVVLCTLPTLGWYLKNQVQYGFFGSSSWFGSNLYRMVAANRTQEELQDFMEAGVVEPDFVARRYFDPPSRFRELGYDLDSPIPVLSRDDYNNLNMVEISRMHGRNAKALRAADPAHYARNVWEAYGRFTSPSHETQFVRRNAARIAPHVRVYEWLLLRPWLHREREGGITSLYSLWIPGLLLLQVTHVLIRTGLRPTRIPGYVRTTLVPLFLLLLIAYVSLVSSLYEHGENCRFKVSIEALLLLYPVCLLKIRHR